MNERVSVIIPNWNGARFLPACLHSLRRQTFRDFVAYVVDNGSADESLALLARDFPEAVVVAIPENRGFSAAVNAGVMASRGEYVAALNNDTECDARWLEELVKALELHPEAGFLASKVLGFDDRHVIDSFGDGYTRAGLAFKIGSLELDDGRFDQIQEVFSACAAASIYRRAMLDDIGGFDEDFFCYMEDVDLGLRARFAGYRCLAVPAAKVFHIGAASSGGGPSEFSVHMTTKNLYNVMLKNLPLSLLALMLPLALAAQAWLVINALVRPAGSKLRPHLAAYWQGLGAAARQAPVMIRKRRSLRSMRRVSSCNLVGMIRLSERQRRLGAPKTS